MVYRPSERRLRPARSVCEGPATLFGLTAILLSLACGGADPAPAQAPGGPSGANQHGHRGFVGGRKAGIPKSSDTRERIVFVSGGSVYIAGADGSDREQLSVRGIKDGHESPALSPDGTKLAYIAPKDGHYQLVVMDLLELVPQALTDLEFGQAGDPAWSPDGTQLALMRGDPRDKRDLVLLPVGGGQPRVLVEGNDDHPEHGGTPAWSPDGKTIVFSSDRRLGKGSLLWNVDTQSGVLTRLTRGKDGKPFFRDRYPAWTPDGKRIVFASNRHVAAPEYANDEELYVTDAAGKRMVRLTDGKGMSTDPSVSPDGRRVFFTSTRDAKAKFETEIYVMAIQGGAAARLTRDSQPQNQSPSVGRASVTGGAK